MLVIFKMDGTQIKKGFTAKGYRKRDEERLRGREREIEREREG